MGNLDLDQALSRVRRKLLDLSNRNRLINFRHTASGSLRIVDEMPDIVYKRLLNDKGFKIVPVPRPTDAQLISIDHTTQDEKTGEIRTKAITPAQWAPHIGLNLNHNLPAAAYDPGQIENKHVDAFIQTALFPNPLEKTLRKIAGLARTAIEESGSNMLYLAFGFLEWSEEPGAKIKAAPLLLLPVTLKKGDINKYGTYDYRLFYSGDVITANLSLQEKLDLDYGIELPFIEENESPENYLTRIKELIAFKPHWQVKRQMTLSLFQFGKLLMYRDLDPAAWPKERSLTDHKILRRFLAGEGANLEVAPSAEEYDIDHIEDILQKAPLIDAADSSQHSAIIDALEGRSLVIEGPPGTGKSQTITNMIGALLSQGRSVLFISEKLAALEVVYRKLDAAGLGDFCLELHSHKAGRKQFLANLNDRLKKRKKFPSPRAIKRKIKRYEELRTKLKTHAELINMSWIETGLTIHQILCAAARHRSEMLMNPSFIKAESFDVSRVNENYQAECVKTLNSFTAATSSIIGDGKFIHEHPWCGIKNEQLQGYDTEKVSDCLRSWRDTLQPLKESLSVLSDLTKAPFPDSLDQLEKIKQISENLPHPVGDEFFDAIPRVLNENKDNILELYLTELNEFDQSRESLLHTFKSNFIESLQPQPKLHTAAAKLEELFNNPKVKLDELPELIKNFYSLEKRIEDIRQTVKDVASIFGPAIELNDHGFKYLHKLHKVCKDITPSILKYRTEVFDSDAEPRLRALKERQKELHVFQDSLKELFRVDKFYSQSELEKIIKHLEEGGIFSMFSSDFREASEYFEKIKAINNQHSTHQDKVNSLKKLLEYQKLVDTFNDDCEHEGILLGFHTNFNEILGLQDWYNTIREEFGMGIGESAAIGEKLTLLDASKVQGLGRLASMKLFTEKEEIDQEVARLSKLLPGAKMHQLEYEFSNIRESLEDISTKVKGHLLKDNIPLSQWLKHLQEYETQLSRQKYLTDAEELRHLAPAYHWNEEGLKSLTNTLSLIRFIKSSKLNETIRQFLIRESRNESYNELENRIKLVLEHYSRFNDRLSVLQELTQLDLNEWLAQDDPSLEDVDQRIGYALTNKSEFVPWLDYLRICKKIETLGITQVQQRAEEHHLELGKVVPAFLFLMHDALCRDIFKKYPQLRDFIAYDHESLQKSFLELDNELVSLQRRYVASTIDKRKIPRGRSTGRVKDLTELALINHEITKKAQHIPIRQLINRAGQAMQALKPCFMMGPLSVAQYLDPATLQFDVLVMDEASQMCSEDAYGAIARSKQVIIVGDSKQLAPTSFFKRMDQVDEEDEERLTVEDAESILSAALPIFQPGRKLRWHYRSRHESLITFSNQQFYNSELVVFPAPYDHHAGLGIRHLYVEDGRFNKGLNVNEAKAIARTALEHMATSPQFSLGIVAMNTTQREYIEIEVEKLCKENPEIRKRFDKMQPVSEPFFVKNLENVQGDERDFIFISFTYGPSEDGVLRQRFGPINNPGGERRLNVLFTRSRRLMKAFTSLTSTQINIKPSTRDGVKALKGFLQFAESGRIEKITEDKKEKLTDFQLSLSASLMAAGYSCKHHIGACGVYIDMAVFNPDDPETFLLGIETDGPAYLSARTVRDRDLLRRSVLLGLGWKMERIWATDWYKSSQAETNRLIRLLEELRHQAPQETPEPMEIIEKEEHVPEIDISVEEEPDEILEQKHSVLKPHEEKVYIAGAEWASPYKSWKHQEYPTIAESNSKEIITNLRDIVECEGPIARSRAFKLYLQAARTPRQTDELQDKLNSCVQDALDFGLFEEEGSGELSYLRLLNTPQVRVRAPGPRSFEEIPHLEVEAIIGMIKERTDSKGHTEAISEFFNLSVEEANNRPRLKKHLQNSEEDSSISLETWSKLLDWSTSKGVFEQWEREILTMLIEKIKSGTQPSPRQIHFAQAMLAEAKL